MDFLIRKGIISKPVEVRKKRYHRLFPKITYYTPQVYMQSMEKVSFEPVDFLIRKRRPQVKLRGCTL